MDQGKLDDAIREFNIALKIDPAMANAYYGLGCVLVKQNRSTGRDPVFFTAKLCGSTRISPKPATNCAALGK